jgi:hypothetical protein
VAVEVHLGFEEPGEGRRDGDNSAGVLLAVVGLGALEDSASWAVRRTWRVSPSKSSGRGGTSPSLMPVSVKVRTKAS